jgi:hypothetical protein
MATPNEFDAAGVASRARRSTDVAPQTLGGVAAHIDLLAPIAAMIHNQTRTESLLGTDATGLPVLDSDVPEGIRSGTSWCWTKRALGHESGVARPPS